MIAVYLCGPIFGQSDSAANDWRRRAARALSIDYVILDPMVRDYRGREQEPDLADRIVREDTTDIDRATHVLVNAENPGWGTAMETQLSFMYGKYVVAFCSKPPSPWLRARTHLIVPTLDGALEHLRKVGEKCLFKHSSAKSGRVAPSSENILTDSAESR